ncbi:hypothetical protein FB45DRAFT_751572 [Roridomyces roridus]|uniref:Uncharacterized protein n=1 Tax=Roridomyces roridus TaxID=1738132 RepID=A0AAD7BMG9_9AGAR|nr:hypothetical protein FB45DRAFT_751572 [Roridomyces roridus]
MGSPFATQEDHESLWYEQSNYVSTHLASVGYGIHMVVFATVIYYTLLARTRSRARPKYMWIVCLVFNIAVFSMGTINLACSIRYNENAWVNDRGYPGGPFNYLVEQQAIPFMTLGNVASILASFLSDGLLLYRAGVLWNFSWYIIVPPAIFFVACIVLSVMVVIQFALPNVALPQLSLAVWIVLMILPIWLTGLIAGRMLYHRRTMIKTLGPSYAEAYTGVSAIVVESAVPFTVISIVLLGLFGDKNTAQNLFVPLMVQVESIAPELIILRVIMGRAWSQGTLSGEVKPAPTEFHFATSHKRDPEADTLDDPAFGAELQTRSLTSHVLGTQHDNRTSIVVMQDRDDSAEK